MPAPEGSMETQMHCNRGYPWKNVMPKGGRFGDLNVNVRLRRIQQRSRGGHGRDSFLSSCSPSPDTGDNLAFGLVVWGQLNADFVARQDADVVSAKVTGDKSKNIESIVKIYSEL